MSTPTSSAPPSVWRAVRDDLRARRQTRASRRDLEAELATYRRPSEINDLLGMIRAQDSPEADAVRELLVRNLRQSRSANRLAS